MEANPFHAMMDAEKAQAEQAQANADTSSDVVWSERHYRPFRAAIPKKDRKRAAIVKKLNASETIIGRNADRDN